MEYDQYIKGHKYTCYKRMVHDYGFMEYVANNCDVTTLFRAINYLIGLPETHLEVLDYILLKLKERDIDSNPLYSSVISQLILDILSLDNYVDLSDFTLSYLSLFFKHDYITASKVRYFDDNPMTIFDVAIKYQNFKLINYIISLPGSDQSYLLERINNSLKQYDAIRETIISKINPFNGSRKRSRYTLD